MKLELNKLLTSKETGLKFNFTIFCGFLTEILLILIGISLIGIFPPLDSKYLFSAEAFFSTIGFPIIILLSLFLIFRYVTSINALLLSFLVSTLTTLILNGIGIFLNSDFKIWDFISDYLSVFVMIYFWIVLVQTQKNKARALSVGLFLFFVVGRGITFIELLVVNKHFEYSYFISILFFAILAGIFEFIIINISKLIKLELKY